jgi:hypothetical protein
MRNIFRKAVAVAIFPAVISSPRKASSCRMKKTRRSFSFGSSQRHPHDVNVRRGPLLTTKLKQA